MVRGTQLVFILFFSVQFGALIRSASFWWAFPTHFFRLPDRDLRRQEGRRLVVGLLWLNLLPFAYAAVSLYGLSFIHKQGGPIMMLDFFCAPLMTMAVPGFFRIYQGLIIRGGETKWPATWKRIRDRHDPFADATAYLVPGALYVAFGVAVQVVLLNL